MRGGNLILVTRPGLEVTPTVTMIGGSVRPARGPKQPVILRVELAASLGGNVVVRPPRRTLWQWLLRRP